MNNAHNSLCLCVFLLFSSLSVNAAKNVAGVSGAITKTIADANASVPKYAVVSAGVSADAVYSGQIASVTSNTISFESSSDSSEVTVNPFVSGVFNSSVRSPILTSALSGAGVGSIPITYAGTGFSTAPEIVIDYPTSGDDQATATATISSGAISGITITNAGSGYDAAPGVTVIGGPYLVKLTESGDDDEGRVFLITDNNATHLTLDTSKLASGESLSNVLQTDYSVEVVRAPTLGSVFGETASDLDLNPSSANGSTSGADFVYLYNGFQYVPYAYMPSGSGRDAGWYSSNYMRWGRRNHLVIYPDEGFIVAKRTPGTLTLDFDGGVSTSDQKMQLPVTSGAVVINNPYGTDMLLGELIPSETFGTSSVEFRPSVTLTPDDNADQLLFLVDVEWKQFFYKSGVNDGITKTATATAKAGTASSNGLADADVSLANGTISNLQSCTASGGLSVDHNDSNHTLVTLSGTAPQVGFDITFQGIFGNKLNDNGDKELDVNGTEVSNGSGIKIFSGLIGTHQIVARPSDSTIVVRKRRDVNFVSTGPRTWSTGQGGTGYNGTAKAYFMGGGNTTMAVADATVSGGSVTGFDFDGTGNTRGAGYQYAPQVIISGGGWRKVGASDAIQDGEILEATEGIVIMRNNPGPDGNLGTSDDGKLTYFKPKNPFN